MRFEQCSVRRESVCNRDAPRCREHWQFSTKTCHFYLSVSGYASLSNQSVLTSSNLFTPPSTEPAMRRLRSKLQLPSAWRRRPSDWRLRLQPCGCWLVRHTTVRGLARWFYLLLLPTSSLVCFSVQSWCSLIG